MNFGTIYKSFTKERDAISWASEQVAQRGVDFYVVAKDNGQFEATSRQPQSLLRSLWQRVIEAPDA